ncbi:MAG: PAS domain S-box protein [Gemmatimonadaceae bacterium]
MRPASPRLRVRLIGIALLAAVPALLAIVYLGSLERERARARTLSENLRLARLAAAAEAARFDAAQGLLATLAVYPPLAGKDQKECGRILARVLASHPGYLNLTVANADGTLFCTAAPYKNGVVVPAKGKRWFDQAVATKSIAIGEVRPSGLTGKPSIIIGYPILDDAGGVRRVVGASIATDQLRQAVSVTGIPAGATLTLFDTSGTIVLRSPNDDKWSGRRMPDLAALLHLRAGADEDLSDATGVDGVPRLYATVPLRGSVGVGMYLGLGIDRRIAYADADKTLRDEFWLLVLVTLVGILAALAAGNTFVLRPIKALRTVIDRIAAGDLAARAGLVANLGGVGDLVDGVNAMAAAVDARQRERDEAERRLRASEDRYRLLFEQNPNAMWVYDAETLVFLEVNDAAVQRYGYSRDEFLAMHINDIRPPEEAVRLEAFLAQEHGPFTAANTWHHRRKNGEIIDADVTTHEIMFSGRRARLVAAQDVSDRTRAEGALRDAEERIRFALEASKVGVWEANVLTGVATWSETAEAMHGVAPGTYDGSLDAFIACIHPEDREAVMRETTESARERRNTVNEYRAIWPDGTVRQINSQGKFFYAANGTPARGAGIATDVTHQRSMEEQLRQSQKMEAVGQLAGGIAHDFNNLLTVIAGNVEMASLALPIDSPARVDLDGVRTAAVRAAQLTRQLLAFSRKQTLRIEPVDIGEMIAEITPMLRRLIGEDIAIDYSVCSEGPVVNGDRAQLEQVLINLSVNARDAMPKGGRLAFETSVVNLGVDDLARRRVDLEPSTYVTLTVRDTGVGMDADVLAHAFEPFFTTKDVGKGTGLGLSSVYGTVKQSGGHVSASSTLNVGTTITIYLPLRDPASEVPATVSRATNRPDVGEGTILLVEDDDAVRALANRVLKSAGFTVLVAASGHAAIEVARDYAGHISLVLSDVVMPGISGLELASVLESTRPGIAVLLMSGYPDAEIGRRGTRTQNAIIEKPFTRDTLVARVHGAIAEHRATRNAA